MGPGLLVDVWSGSDMKEIILNKGFKAMVDDEDYEILMASPGWHAIKKGNSMYVRRSTYKPINGAIYMHRQILGITDSKIWTDHIDGNPLNNQKSNLRICLPRQNSWNMKKQIRTVNRVTSKFKGVSWSESKKRYSCMINIHGKSIRIGTYHNEKEAALAYNVAASFAFREFANLNII